MSGRDLSPDVVSVSVYRAVRLPARLACCCNVHAMRAAVCCTYRQRPLIMLNTTGWVNCKESWFETFRVATVGSVSLDVKILTKREKKGKPGLIMFSLSAAKKSCFDHSVRPGFDSSRRARGFDETPRIRFFTSGSWFRSDAQDSILHVGLVVSIRRPGFDSSRRARGFDETPRIRFFTSGSWFRSDAQDSILHVGLEVSMRRQGLDSSRRASGFDETPRIRFFTSINSMR
ncbi:hypothetical protein RRG08_047743 [Elysia crispata]|uniref:Uncharacterized protein n=1 Tax=Elysia crispata TaxID=231223 RepID=A0AAE0ZRU0_9GAST|nr:hypothetical protein RRG08_047743 [Elysia crispata]